MQAKIGKPIEFDSALRKLRGKDVDVSEEAAEIKVSLSKILTFFYVRKEYIKIKGVIISCNF